MGRAAIFIPILLACSASASAKIPATVADAAATSLASIPASILSQTAAAAATAATAGQNINSTIAEWRRLRQGGNLSFANYAHFLNYNQDWPAEAALRRDAEKAMRPGENASLVLGFYRLEKPKSGNGWTRYSDALSNAGRGAEAITAAKQAWASSDLSAADEAYILARFGAHLTTADHDKRVDALLFDKDPTDASRLLAWTSPIRRPAFAARIAMQSRDPNAETSFRAAAHRLAADSGLLMDRLRYLRDGGNENMARQLAAQPHQFTERPADPERWYEMMLILANGAAQDRQWQLTYNIARQLDDALPQGAQLADQSYGIRDNYTSLAWLAGRTALDRIGSANNAVAMFYRYAQGGKSLQVATKGWYWAGRAALAAGRPADASAYFQRAAAYPELFYGQLALERLGRSVPAPGYAHAVAPTDPTRAAFAQKTLVQATRAMMYRGSANERMQFVRALSESVKTPAERALAIELSRQLGRQDLAVWVARSSRNDGDAYYVRDAFPTLRSTPRTSWSLAHGITRQESSFDPYAISHAGARGMMQLMPGTAREQAGKLGVGYDSSRIHDPDYNVMLGSAYFQRMLNTWNGSVPLAVASYNAGPGNVRKWINAYGDPRSARVDMIGWIEAIPFSETRGYVQRVIENSVVYDSMRPQPQSRTAL
ncbi:MAG TPA: lytic transglycosylase domain-containing protein, partial [Sphingomicrobium sp.]|nr:lytic transglycosylase domain-containing protein [Sphingomicrobium sp.]